MIFYHSILNIEFLLIVQPLIIKDKLEFFVMRYDMFAFVYQLKLYSGK